MVPHLVVLTYSDGTRVSCPMDIPPTTTAKLVLDTILTSEANFLIWGEDGGVAKAASSLARGITIMPVKEVEPLWQTGLAPVEPAPNVSQQQDT